METIKAINEWSFQLMFLALSISAMAWMGVGIMEAMKFVAREWFKPVTRTTANSKSPALNGAKE